jgi:hypothetical protein
MKPVTRIWLATVALAQFALAKVPPLSTKNDPFHLGYTPFTPVCTHACWHAITTNTYLTCTVKTAEGYFTAPECYADNAPFLQTLATCLHSNCEDIPNATLSSFFSTKAPGYAPTGNPPVKTNYVTSLQNAGEPVGEFEKNQIINATYKVPDGLYEAQVDAFNGWNRAEIDSPIYAVALLGIGFFLPVLFSWLRFLPTPSSLNSKVHAYLVYPSALGRRWVFSMRDAGDVSPTRGQLILIVWTVMVNVILTSIGHYAALNNNWTMIDRHGRLIDSFSNRLGQFAIANLPLLFLYAGRNNPLIWVTGKRIS